MANCVTCSANNTCSECAPTFISGSNGSCVCPSGSSLINNNSSCGCNTNFTFNPNTNEGLSGICLANCGIEGCINCQTNNSTGTSICNECKLGFKVLNNACIEFCPIDNCNDGCTAIGFCSNCVSGFVPSTFADACVTCNQANCQSCEQSNVCYTCNPGYTVTATGTCRQCNVTNCLSCGATNFCSTCFGIYTANS